MKKSIDKTQEESKRICNLCYKEATDYVETQDGRNWNLCRGHHIDLLQNEDRYITISNLAHKHANQNTQ